MKSRIRMAFALLILPFLAGCTGKSLAKNTAVDFTPAVESAATSETKATDILLNEQATQAYLLSPEPWMGPVPDGARVRLGKGELKSVDVSPDGKSLAVVSDDGVFLYDADTFSQKWVYPTALPAGQIAFSPKGDILAVGFHQGEIHLLNAESGTLNSKIQGEWDHFRGLSFSADGGLLAYCGDDSIYIWDLTKAALLKEYSSKNDSPVSLSLSPDGTILAVGFYQSSNGPATADTHTIGLLDVKTGDIIRIFRGHTGLITHVVFSPDGKSIASESNDGSVRMWDAATGNPLWEIDNVLQSNADYNLAFSPDGKALAVATTFNPILMLDASSGEEKSEIKDSDFSILGFVFSPSGEVIYAISIDGIFTLSTSGGIINYQFGFMGGVNDLAISPDGKTLAVSQSGVSFWDMKTLSEKVPGRNQYYYGPSLAFSPDGTLFAVRQYDHTINLIDTSSLLPRQSLSVPSDWPGTILFSPDGKFLASVSGDQEVILWDAVHWTKINTLETPSSSIIDLAFSPDGKTLASVSMDNSITLWDTASGNLLKTLSLKGEYELDSVAFTPDGNSLFSVYDGKLIRWDIASGTPVEKQSISSCPASSINPHGKVLAIFPGGNLAIGCGNGNIVLWDVKSDSATYLKGHNNAITALHIAPDGKTIVSGSRDGSVVIWNSLEK